MLHGKEFEPHLENLTGIIGQKWVLNGFWISSFVSEVFFEGKGNMLLSGGKYRFRLLSSKKKSVKLFQLIF